MKISIVVPVFHEEKTIAKLLAQIAQKVKSRHEVLIIYDYEKDPTVKAVTTYLKQATQNNILLIKNSEGNKRGVTNAMRTGFAKVKGDAAVAVMADLSDDLSDIDKMTRLIEKGADIVCGSRYMKGGKKVGGPVLKTFLSRLAGLSLHLFFRLPTHDATNAFKMYRKTLLNKVKIESTGGFEYSLEITLKAFKLGYRIAEIPTVWYDRPEGKSNFKLFRWLPKYMKTYFIIVTHNQITKFNYASFRRWRNEASKKITLEQHLMFLFVCLIFSTLIYTLIILSFHFAFSITQTTAINWLTVFNYPKQQDYYFLYSFFGFNFIIPILLWFIWVSLKIKK
jgi:dolichol-phosphate mannosyltransferase